MQINSKILTLNAQRKKLNDKSKYKSLTTNLLLIMPVNN